MILFNLMIVCGYSYSHVYEVHYLCFYLQNISLLLLLNQSSIGQMMLRRIFVVFFVSQINPIVLRLFGFQVVDCSCYLFLVVVYDLIFTLIFHVTRIYKQKCHFPHSLLLYNACLLSNIKIYCVLL